jgi:hypothetical protein
VRDSDDLEPDVSGDALASDEQHARLYELLVAAALDADESDDGPRWF